MSGMVDGWDVVLKSGGCRVGDRTAAAKEAAAVRREKRLRRMAGDGRVFRSDVGDKGWKKRRG